MHALMDFNQAFQAYDSIRGANCQTLYPRKLNQKEAAVEAVEQIGLNQIMEIESSWFDGREKEYEMLMKRLQVLQDVKK